jgi:hypothetical protein
MISILQLFNTCRQACSSSKELIIFVSLDNVETGMITALSGNWSSEFNHKLPVFSFCNNQQLTDITIYTISQSI